MTKPPAVVWKRPATRRAFVALLGAAAAAAAAAAVALKIDSRKPDSPAPTAAAPRLPRWIGHV